MPRPIPIKQFIDALIREVPEDYLIEPAGRLAGCLNIRSPRGAGIAATIPFAQFGQGNLIMWLDGKDHDQEPV
jgi:hypothetical protein